MKAHGEQKRASGDPVFLASARSRGDPDRSQARRRDHRRGAAARHHRGYRGHARRDRPAVRPRHRRAGRRPDQAEEARSRHQGSQAGRKPAQAVAGDRRRRARAAGQARRPPAQHAHARITCRPASRRRTAEETLDIYAPLAGRMGMQEMREELEDLSFRELYPDAYQVVTARLDCAGRAQRASDRRRSSSSSPRSSPTAASTARGYGPATSAPIRSGARWSASRSASSSSPTSSASASS